MLDVVGVLLSEPRFVWLVSGGDDRACTGVLGDGDAFVRRQPPVHRDEDSAAACAAEQQLDQLLPVGEHGQHPVTRLQSRGRQAGGDPRGAVVQLGKGARSGRRHQRDGIGAVHEVVRHAGLPSSVGSCWIARSIALPP